jgi:putative heme iron utilization protein
MDDPTLSAADSAAICEHMNDDHGDAIAAYARAYAGIPEVTAAEMLSLDERGMELGIDTAAGRIVKHVAFDHVLTGKDDARETLIAMARHAMSGA